MLQNYFIHFSIVQNCNMMNISLKQSYPIINNVHIWGTQIFKGEYMNFLKKHFSIIAAAALLFVASFNFPTAFAAEIDANAINPVVVENTIKPTLMSQKFEANKNAQARIQKLTAVKAEQTRRENVAKTAAQAKAKAAAAAKAKAAAAAKAKAQAQTVSQAPTKTVSGVNKGQFKLSFYDPAVLGSNMGYSGVAANLSVFPKGTRLKITLSNGTVWYRTVNDTGTFAYANPRQLDVAMPSNMIPSAGILYATVEVL